MKKVQKESFNMLKGQERNGHDEIFNPDDNLYNNPLEPDSLTFKPKVKHNTKGQISRKNEK